MNKRILCLLLCLIAMLSVSAVSAIDDNVTEDNLNVKGDSILTVSTINYDVNEETVSEGVTIGDNSYAGADNSVIYDENTNLKKIQKQTNDDECNFDSNTVVSDLNVEDNGSKVSSAVDLYDALKKGGLITFTQNITIHTNFENMGLVVNQNNTIIDGDNHFITSNGNYMMFNIIANNVTIKNLKLINCAFHGRPAIKWVGNDGKLFNCSFENNSGCYYGSALSSDGKHIKNMLVVNSTFINNKGTRGGAVCLNGENITFFNSKFINNNGTTLGGAIYYWGVENSKIINCTFINGFSSKYAGAGAVYIQGNNNTIDYSVFINNTGGDGGAVCVIYSDNSILNSIFINNTANYEGKTEYGIIRTFDGGAIVMQGDGVISNCTFKNNKAHDGGGAIYNCGGVNIMVNDNIFINNTANLGGAIYNYNYDSKYNTGDISVYNSTFINNNAIQGGGAIYNYADSFVGYNNNFTNNDASKGSAIYNDMSQYVKSTINLTNNKYSGVTGDKTYIYNEGIIISSVTVTVLENQTINIVPGEKIKLIANINTSDGASVTGGLLKFIINSTNYFATSEDNGDYNYNYTAIAGKHLVGVTYANATNLHVKTAIINAKSTDILDVEDIVMNYRDGTRLVAKLTDCLGNPIANATIYFTIMGVVYNRITDINGSVSLGISLISGTYDALISYNDISVNSTIIIKSSIMANNIVKMYQNGTQFYTKFLNIAGNPLVNADVRFNINGVFYTRETNEEGIAKLSINLMPGHYILTAINPVNNEQVGYNVTVKSLAEANDLTKYYKNESKFESKIYNKDGSLAINKEVKFNINGVFYTRTTDENGIAKLGINLRPGDYVITTIVDGLESGNNVKILPTVLASDLNMNFQDGSKFTAKTLDGQGKPLASQSVSFNVNGVFYNRVSDENGVASLTINLNRGEYIITSMWNDYQVGNKITIS